MTSIPDVGLRPHPVIVDLHPQKFGVSCFENPASCRESAHMMRSGSMAPLKTVEARKLKHDRPPTAKPREEGPPAKRARGLDHPKSNFLESPLADSRPRADVPPGPTPSHEKKAVEREAGRRSEA